MKRALTVLVMLSITCTAVLADAPERDFGFIVSGGSSLFDSHVAAGVDLGRLSVMGTVYTGFPNMAVINMINGTDDDIFTLVLQSFAFGVGVTGSCTYDLIPSERFDLDLGGSICAMYMPLLEIFRIHSIIGLTFSFRMSWNINGHSGIYVGTEIPLAGIVTGSRKDKETGVETGYHSFQTVLTQTDMLLASFAAAAYFARVGYEYRF